MRSSDKTLLYVLGGLAALGGLCIVCIVAAVFFPARLWMNGSAPETAKKFLSTNLVVKAKIGDVTRFGLFPSGSVKIVDGAGSAHLTFSLKGGKGEGQATVDLSKAAKGDWKVTGATLYVGGQTFALEGKGASEPSPSEPEVAPPGGQGTDVPAQDTGSLPASRFLRSLPYSPSSSI